MVKIYTPFQTKTAQKLFGLAHTYIAYIGEYPPRGSSRFHPKTRKLESHDVTQIYEQKGKDKIWCLQFG